MLLAFHTVDYAVLLLYLSGMLLIGFYFRHSQRTSSDFFLAGRSMSWFPVGLSVLATLLSGLTYTGLPGEAYRVGFKFLLLPATVWLTAPLVVWFFLPIYRGLNLYSVYEYLERRFDASTRLAGSLVFLIWRLLWLGAVLYAPCLLLKVAANVNIPLWVLILTTGLGATLYTFLGGMKAVIWTDVVQAFVMLFGVVAVVLGCWWSLEGGPRRVWEISQAFGRTEILDTEFSWTSYWTVWGIVPHYFLSMLSFYVADQITAQRYLTARSVRDAQRSFWLNCISVTIMTGMLAYLGMCLLSFYYDHPNSMRPRWVANVDGETRQSLTYADRDRLAGTPNPSSDTTPLLDWTAYNDQVTRESVERLVEERRLLHPNRKLPFDDVAELLDPNDSQRVNVDQLAMRQPPPEGLQRGEVVLHAKAKDELLPWFIATQLPLGIAGIIVAGVFAATMSSMDSGLNSITTLVIMDLHRRYGWGRGWLSRKRNKSAHELTEEDELVLGRPLTLLVGVAATLFSFAISRIGDIFSIMLGVVNTFGASLLGVFLLGLFTRRCTARGALIGLAGGTLFTIWLTVANSYPLLSWMWPFETKLNSIWPVTFGTLATIAIGYGASFFVGTRRDPASLRGLVVGCGTLGKTPDA